MAKRAMQKSQVINHVDQVVRLTRKVEHLSSAIAVLMDVRDPHTDAIANELSRMRDETQTLCDRSRSALMGLGK